MPAPDASSPMNTMYGEWFLDYASYVILERAVPHLVDGLKPVQRRILHSLWEKHDGRYHKVANLVGHTMQYHPHGDASIGEALTQLGQKQLLIDTQGNWGNIYTGDNAAAPRYIEAKLSAFALEVAFNPKTTVWAASYDGRSKEPVNLPMKFPLVLAQGVDGIAVGLACKILPHNFNELIDACIKALKKEDFVLYPDFLHGGQIDVSEYADGLRGSRVRVRAGIEITKPRMLTIRDIPFGTTTESLQASIADANAKGKIKIQKIEDLTADKVEIQVHLHPGTEPEQAIQALYAFTDCEVSIAPNACVIEDNKPRFLGVKEILVKSAFLTRALLKLEQEIRLGELEDKWHLSSLEKIFIENRIYRRIEECTTWEAVIREIWTGLKPFLHLLKRPVVEEDILKLTEIRIKRISKYDSFKAEELIRSLEREIKETNRNLRNLTNFTIDYFENLKRKYGKGRERRTQIASFERVVAREVAVANETLYVNRQDGFVGWGLKKDEELGPCSRMDDIIAFTREGTMRVVPNAEKVFVGANNIHAAIVQKDASPVYHLIYRDGRDGPVYAKRFRVQGFTRNRVYDLTKGTPGTRVLHFSVHDDEAASNGQNLMVHLRPALRLRNLEIPFNFGSIAIKGRDSQGNIITRHVVDRIVRAQR